MKNKSDTNLIRHYCKLHQNQIFDVHDVMKEFKEVTPSNFRKYVSRLVEEQLLWPVSKGVYFIGYKPDDDQIDLAIAYYYSTFARPAKEWLLYRCGIIEKEPEVRSFYICWDQGNKKIRDVQLIGCRGMVMPLNEAKITTLDIISQERNIPEDDLGNYVKFLSKVLPHYKEVEYWYEPEVDHPRWVYVRLANLLDSMHISNRVMEYYENKIKGTDRLE